MSDAFSWTGKRNQGVDLIELVNRICQFLYIKRFEN